MKKSTLIVAILLGLTACSPSTKSIQPEEQSLKKGELIIDLDKEMQLKERLGDLRGEKHLLLDTPIYIGDNDEVSFNGDIIEKRSPVTITIGMQESRTFTGTHYTIQTSELKEGDTIELKDKHGEVFVNVKVLF